MGLRLPLALVEHPRVALSDPRALQFRLLGWTKQGCTRGGTAGVQQCRHRISLSHRSETGSSCAPCASREPSPLIHSSTLGEVPVLKSSVRIHSAAAETHRREQLQPRDMGPQLAVAQQTFLLSQELLSSPPVRAPAPSNAMALLLMVLTPRAIRGCHCGSPA